MPRPAGTALLDRFAALKDPRPQAKVLYPLPEILLLLLCATLAGADDLVEIELWGNQQLEFLRRFLPYTHGIPSHDTLGAVIGVLDPERFKRCFAAWVEGLREAKPDLVAIDGKTSRRTHARGKGREPLHLVSAWATRQRLVLGQEAVAGKSNEIAAIPLLLERLALQGALVTIDAIGTQAAIAATIRARGGDYLPASAQGQPSGAPAGGHDLLRRPTAGPAPPVRDHRGRPRPDRDSPPRRLPRHRLAVLRSALPR
jgi:DDE_Tnp_1-associated/Transposase DDE domain